MRALIATVDLSVAASVKATLATENLICDTTDLGDDCRKIGKLCDYDIILFDLQLRDSGYEVLRWLRMANVQTPILILSGLPELGHKITALGFSVDDCLTKPFDGRELVRRIQAIVQRSKDHSESTIRTGKLVVNLDTRVVSVEDQPVHLTGKEYSILELLSLKKGTTLTKEMFLNHLYGGMNEPEVKIIDVFVCKLRKKLAQAIGGKHYIETVWGRGYVLHDPTATPAETNVVGPEHLGARAAQEPRRGQACRPSPQLLSQFEERDGVCDTRSAGAAAPRIGPGAFEMRFEDAVTED
jgi:two-component system cell cycle response regulator CtrA